MLICVKLTVCAGLTPAVQGIEHVLHAQAEAMVADKPENPGAGAPAGGMPDMAGTGGMM